MLAGVDLEALDPQLASRGVCRSLPIIAICICAGAMSLSGRVVTDHALLLADVTDHALLLADVTRLLA
jgi:hypothetical protein